MNRLPNERIHECLLACLLMIASYTPWLSSVSAEESQASRRPRIRSPKLTVEHIHYRPVRYETEKVRESQNERPNRGGLVFLYLKNTSGESVHLRSWYLNRKGGDFYRLGGSLAWDRLHHSNLAPGQMTVLEISGISEDFAAGAPFEFAFIGRSWRPIGGIEAALEEDPICVSFIRVLPDRRQVEIHIRNRSTRAVDRKNAEIVGKTTENVEWVTEHVPAQGRSIGRLRLAEPLTAGQLIIVRVDVSDDGEDRSLYAHRNAHADRFPIGTWGAEPEMYAMTRHHHIDTIVKGGNSNDPFYSQEAARYGFHTMVHTGVLPNVDVLRDLGNHPAVNCWMIHDEPDWHYTPQKMLTAAQMTRKYNSTTPTFITLCRNVKFFEYAFLPDIACQDHYSVTAPSSSRWPKRYGTRLEETAYYTRDLKYAAEPKPIWIWTQGMANWSERPKRPVPTVDELTAQLLLNLGRGAKGILWFTFNKSVGEKYPELRTAIQGWGRIMELTREDLLGSEPIETEVDGPQDVDVALLASWNKLFVVVFNQDYEIHDEAYPWQTKENVKISFRLPEWIKPETFLELTPEGVGERPYAIVRGRFDLSLETLRVARVFVLCNQSQTQVDYANRFIQILESESRDF